MIDNYKESLSVFFESAKDLHLPAARVITSYSFSSKSSEEIISSTIYGHGSESAIEVPLNELRQNSGVQLSTRLFEFQHDSKEFQCSSNKITVIGFVNTITDTILSVFKQWQSISSPFLEFFVVSYGKNNKLHSFSSLSIIQGTEKITENFKIINFPHYSILYNSFEIVSGQLENCFISSFMNLLSNYTEFEAFHLYSIENPVNISLYNTSTTSNKMVNLSGLTVIDFWDNTCPEIFNESVEKSLNIKEYKVYVSSEVSNVFCKFSLGNEALNHPTALKLKIIDLPTSFIISNGVVLWKGNRLFTNFNKLLKDLKNGVHENEPVLNINEKNIEKYKKKFEKDSKSVFTDESDAILDMKFFTLFEISPVKGLIKKYRTKLSLHCKNEEDKQKIVTLYNKLKDFMPNLSYEIIRIQEIFGITNVDLSGKNKSKLKNYPPEVREKLNKYKL